MLTTKRLLMLDGDTIAVVTRPKVRGRLFAAFQPLEAALVGDASSLLLGGTLNVAFQPLEAALVGEQLVEDSDAKPFTPGAWNEVEFEGAKAFTPGTWDAVAF